MGQIIPKHSCSVWSTHMAVNQRKYRLLLMAMSVPSHVELTLDQRLAAGITASMLYKSQTMQTYHTVSLMVMKTYIIFLQNARLSSREIQHLLWLITKCFHSIDLGEKGVYLLKWGCFAPMPGKGFIKEKRFEKLNYRKGCRRTGLKSGECRWKVSVKRNDTVVLLFCSRCG